MKRNAYATIIGQIVSAFLGLTFHLTKNREISNGLEYMKPDLKIIKSIYSIGLPAIIAQALMSVMTYGMNIAYQGIFQALNGGMESLIISILRQFLFVLPVAWGFSLLARQSSDMIWTVWTTFIIAEALSCLIATFFMKRIDRKIISELP